jgi:alpha-ribazole phosphatase/probable phosphoglycerate mutase
MALELVFETHSTTTDNEAGIATGWLPGRLSQLGRAQAAELGERRRHDRIAIVYVSDLARAQETAQIAFADRLELITDARLRECNYGLMNGTPVAALQEKRAAHIHEPWPDGESYLEVVDRTRSLLTDIVARWDGSRVLLIGHSANQWALDHLVLGADLRQLVSRGMVWQPGWEYVVDQRHSYTRPSP